MMDNSATDVPAMDRYDGFARALHWIFAVGIIYATVVGYALHVIPAGPAHDFLSHLNMSLATLLIVLFPIRVWWKFARNDPAPPKGLNARQVQFAHLIQTLVYLAILVVLVSGYLMVPDGYRLFGLVDISTPFAKGDVTGAFFLLHRIGCAVLTGLVCLHLLGVIVHTLIRPTGLLRRMI